MEKSKNCSSEEKKRNLFWSFVEHEMNINVPAYIKNIFRLQYLDNPETIAHLKENNILQLEDFVQSQLYADNIPENSNLINYYNMYHKCPQNFKFSIGHKIMILNISTFCKSKPTFWKLAEETINPFSAKRSDSLETDSKLCDDCACIYKIDKTGAINSSLLEMLIQSLKNNVARKKQGYRYEYSLKLVAAYFYLVGGPILYETMSSNLPIPSISIIRKFVQESSSLVIEGACRIEDLKTFLKARNLTNKVWLSEDATRLCNKVQYDSNTNQLIGFVLPLDKNAMPKAFSFLATSARVMEEHFKNNEISNLLYVFMVQPLQKDAPTFPLCIFGNRNSFTADDVVKRWKFITKCLEEEEIYVIGYSSDGDSRLLKAMRNESSLGMVHHNDYSLNNITMDIPEFHGKFGLSQIFIQDTVHIGTKLRNRLLKHSLILPMGKFIASKAHLNIIMNVCSKDKHYLTEKDINGKDKMNFASVVKLCSLNIIKLLTENIPDSLATQVYLKIIFYVLNSFLSTSLKVSERIYCIWYATFFLRMWRKWLDNHDIYSVQDNFISTNAYICIELNAHGLLNAVFHCMEWNNFDTFLPWMFSSQPCESFFRNLRSTSTTFSTIVNCTLLESLYRIRRLQFINDVFAYDFKEIGLTINFPRKTFLHASFETQNEKLNLPFLDSICGNNLNLSVEVIKNILFKAKCDAHKTVESLGMDIAIHEATNLLVKDISNDDSSLNEDLDEENYDVYENNGAENEIYICDDEELFENLEESSKILSDFTDLQIKDYSSTENVDGNNSPFTFVKDKNNKEILVRKSSICWLLSKSQTSVSADRLQRVKENESQISKHQHNVLEDVQVCDTIFVGNWCLFHSEGKENKYLIGLVLGFAYYKENIWRNIEYSNNYAQIKNNKKSVGVLCQWYDLCKNKLVLQNISCNGYLDISHYKLSIPAPMYNNNCHYLNDNIYNKIKKFFKS